jgi:hypothetical protein
MLNLPIPEKKDVDAYFSLIKDRVTGAVQRSHLSAPLKNFLDETQIRNLITARPQDLLDLHIHLMDQIVPGFDQQEFKQYRRIRSNQANQGVVAALRAQYSVTGSISRIFNYDDFISGDKKTSYWLAALLNRNTCTYCNRLYTVTVNEQKKNPPVSEQAGLTRPQFDHWYPKDLYPALSLSFFNLIPSCTVCNSTIKRNEDFSLNDFTHPYITEPLESFKYNYFFKSLNELSVVLQFHGQKAKRTAEAFRLQEVYDAHASLELKDLYQLRYAYPDNYLQILITQTFSQLNLTTQEAYRMIFGTESSEAEFHKRPFSKFKRDILEQLGIII